MHSLIELFGLCLAYGDALTLARDMYESFDVQDVALVLDNREVRTKKDRYASGCRLVRDSWLVA